MSNNPKIRWSLFILVFILAHIVKLLSSRSKITASHLRISTSSEFSLLVWYRLSQKKMFNSVSESLWRHLWLVDFLLSDDFLLCLVESSTDCSRSDIYWETPAIGLRLNIPPFLPPFFSHVVLDFAFVVSAALWVVKKYAAESMWALNFPLPDKRQHLATRH